MSGDASSDAGSQIQQIAPNTDFPETDFPGRDIPDADDIWLTFP
jgi:hypothetical protein